MLCRRRGGGSWYVSKTFTHQVMDRNNATCTSIGFRTIRRKACLVPHAGGAWQTTLAFLVEGPSALHFTWEKHLFIGLRPILRMES